MKSNNNLSMYAVVFVMVGLLVLPAITANLNKVVSNETVCMKTEKLIAVGSNDTGISQFVTINLTDLGMPGTPCGQYIDGDTFVSWSNDPTNYSDSGYAGTDECLDGNLFSYSVPFVHTYNNKTGPGMPKTGMGVYSNLFIGDLRTDRTKAYFITYNMDYKKYNVSDWRGFPLAPPGYGDVVVMENTTFPRTYFGSYCIALARNTDALFNYRNNIYFYKEIYRDEYRIRFAFEKMATSQVGFWFYDTPPYTKIFSSTPFTKMISIDNMILSQKLQLSLQGTISC